MAFRITELTINVSCEDHEAARSDVAVIYCRAPKSPRSRRERAIDILGPVHARLDDCQLAEIKAQLKEALAELDKEL